MPLVYVYIANKDLMYSKTDENANYLVKARIELKEIEIIGCYNSIRKEWQYIAVPVNNERIITRIENTFNFLVDK